MRNTSNETSWFDSAKGDSSSFVLEEIKGDTIHARYADPCDSNAGRIQIDPGQRISIATPIAYQSICLSDTVGANDQIYWMRVVPDGRDGQTVFGRTLGSTEPDNGRRIHLRDGEQLTFRPGSITLTLDEIDDFYRSIDPDRPDGSVASMVRVWAATTGIQPPALHRIVVAGAHRLDAATHLLHGAEQVRHKIGGEDPYGGPSYLIAVNELLHLTQEAIISLARCVKLLEAARSHVSFTIDLSAIEPHQAALVALRDAYEHIDERAVGATRGRHDPRNLMIFDNVELVRGSVIEYLDHRLTISDLQAVAVAARSAIKQLIGGPPPEDR